MQVSVEARHFDTRLHIYPSRPQAQILAWMIMRGGFSGYVCGVSVHYPEVGDSGELKMYISTPVYSPCVEFPASWYKKIKAGEERFEDVLDFETLRTLAQARGFLYGRDIYELALIAQKNAKKLPVYFEGVNYYIGVGMDRYRYFRCHYGHSFRITRLLAPQSVLTTWDKILRDGEAYFYFPTEC